MGYVSMTHYVINVAIDMLTAEEIDFRIFSVIIEIVHLPISGLDKSPIRLCEKRN